MRRLFILALLLTFTTTVFSQIFVNKTDLNKRAVKYVEVWEKYNKETKKFFAMADYGQQEDGADVKGMLFTMTNDEGAILEFNGIMDVVNYMARNGWEIYYIKTVDKYESYIMRRTDEDAMTVKQQFSTTN